jgi:hypothetical protein
VNTTVRSQIFIEGSPEDIVQVILDPTKAVLWTSNLERFEVVSGIPGEVGSVAHLHYMEKGRPYVMEDTLLAAEPNRRYVSRVSGEALTAEIETVLSPLGPGTQLAIRWTGHGRILLLRLLLPFLRGAIARQAMADLKKLKALVESHKSAAA